MCLWNDENEAIVWHKTSALVSAIVGMGCHAEPSPPHIESFGLDGTQTEGTVFKVRRLYNRTHIYYFYFLLKPHERKKKELGTFEFFSLLVSLYSDLLYHFLNKLK